MVVLPRPVTVSNVLVLLIVRVSVADTTALMSVPSTTVSVLPPSIVCEVAPSVIVQLVVIPEVDNAVICPCASTVITGTAVPLPTDPALTPLFACPSVSVSLLIVASI